MPDTLRHLTDDDVWDSPLMQEFLADYDQDAAVREDPAQHAHVARTIERATKQVTDAQDDFQRRQALATRSHARTKLADYLGYQGHRESVAVARLAVADALAVGHRGLIFNSFYALGQWLINFQRWDEAGVSFQKALRYAKDFGQIDSCLLWLGSVWEKQEHTRSRVPWIEEWRQRMFEPTLSSQARLYQVMRPEAVRGHAEKEAMREPDSCPNIARVVAALGALGRHEEAHANASLGLRRAEETGDEDWRAQFALWLELEGGRSP